MLVRYRLLPTASLAALILYTANHVLDPSSGIHAIIACQNLPLAANTRLCSRCRRESDTCVKPRMARDGYTPLVGRDPYSDDRDAYADIHADAEENVGIAASPVGGSEHGGSEHGSPKGSL